MKKLVVFTVVGVMGLFAAGAAQARGLEMQAFMSCNPTQVIPDAGVSIELRSERIGNFADAVVTHMTIAGVSSEIFDDLKSKENLRGRYNHVSTTYTATKGDRELTLTVDFAEDRDGHFNGVLDLGGFSTEMTCKRFFVQY